MPTPICLRLLAHDERRAFSRARANTGNRIAARIPMMEITTSSSIKVKALRRRPEESPGGDNVPSRGAKKEKNCMNQLLRTFRFLIIIPIRPFIQTVPHLKLSLCHYYCCNHYKRAAKKCV